MKARMLGRYLVPAVAAVLSSCSQPTSVEKFNLDFEKAQGGMPEQWTTFGTEKYVLGIDSLCAFSDRNSAFIASNAENYTEDDFKAWSLAIPESYDGDSVTLSGYLKTENVTDGYAGLWMRIDPGVAFDNMNDRGVKGTTDWTRYEVTLALDPPATKQIVAGALLVGKGKVWVDSLRVTIDGKDIQTLQSMGEKEYPAMKDTEFDKSSGITGIGIGDPQYEALRELGLVWGFLKYYHPSIAAGNYNWDYELFRILPKVVRERNKAVRGKILAEWIGGLGPVTENGDAPKTDAQVKFQPDLAWIENSAFSPELETALLRVKNAKRSKESYYIGMEPGVGNPRFKNEEPYNKMRYPDAGYRILSLFRYWNMIQYYFPYKDLIGEDWKNVLTEFIPRFVDAKNGQQYALATLEIIGRIHDTHANVWSFNEGLNNYFGKNYGAPIVTFIEDDAVVTGFRNDSLGVKSGLAVGDIITRVGGVDVPHLIKERLRFTPASNYPTQLRDIAGKLLRTNDSVINIRYTRNGISMETGLPAYGSKKMNPYHKSEYSDRSYKLLPGNIAYLYPALLKKGEIGQLWSEIAKTKGLIVDLRCYPSDFIVFSLGEKLVPEKTPFVKFSSGSVETPGLFMMTSPLSVGRNNPDHYKGKVVILINEQTQSQAEYTTMALRVAPHATVIGSTTAGADGNMSYFMLPGGIKTGISGIGVYYPDGRETQRVGIVPDIELHPTVKGKTAGRDELLERALQVVR